MGVETVPRLRPIWAIWLSLAALPFAPVTPASAAPEGEQVISGEAAFTRDGDLTQITTYTPQTIVNYTGFDIGVHETVQIDQPGAASRILNNVLSTDPTSIQGRLFSNGQVWIVNPVGVFFGDRAIVDVGSLVAGAGRVADEDFLAGVEHLSDVAGRVEVASGAQIRAADSVLLVGAAVANYGNIRADDGMIALVAGGEVRLARVDGRVVVTADRAVAPDPERWAVVQAGTLDAGRGIVSLTAGDAYSLAMNHEGITRAREIHVEGGDDGLVSIAGTLDASSDAAGEIGGQIAVLGDRVLLGAAVLDASGASGGGEILVGGDYRGGGDTRTASRTYVSPDAVLRADAGTEGDGGRIIVWADDATRFYGSLSARGGSEGGDGGFAEISGAQSLVSRGAIDLGADAGRAGTLLYDPKDIQLVGGSDDGSDTPDLVDGRVAGDTDALGQILFGDLGDLSQPFQIFESEIEGTDANVVLEATNSITATGTFDHVVASEGVGVVRISDGNSLTMSTRNETGDEVGGAADPGIDLTGVSFLASGGVALATGDGDLRVGDITTRGSDGAPGGAGGAVALLAGGTGSLFAGDIDASGGDGSAGDGGAGGQVSLSAIAGPVTVGRIDVSGGNGASGGRGGNGGTISLVADLDPQATAPVVPSGDPRVITAAGDLLARGGDGSGGATDAGAEGGTGGQIFLSAGWLADEGSVVLGSGAQPVRFDASGGRGTAGGGDTATGGLSAFSGAAIGAIRIEAHGDVTADAELVATGGDTDPSVGPGGFGGLGGAVSIESESGGVALNDTGSVFVVTTDGGAGRIDPADVLDANGVAHFDGQGGSAGSLTVEVAGDGSAIEVLGGVSGRGGDGSSGAGGAGGIVTLTAANGAIELSDVDVSGGSGTGSATTAQGTIEVRGGNGGNVVVTTEAADTEIRDRDVDLGGRIVSLGGAGKPDPGATGKNDGVGGTVRVTSVQDIAAAGAADARIQAGTIQLTAQNVFAGTSPDLILASARDKLGSATVQAGSDDPDIATGNVRVLLDNDERFASFELIETDARGEVEVLRQNGLDLIAHGEVDALDDSVHTIAKLATGDDDPHFTYRLADPLVTTGYGGTVEQIDVTTLAVASGAVDLGAHGGTLANSIADSKPLEGERLLGRIQGEGAGPHVRATGNLQIFATNIGDATPLGIAGAAGAAPNLEMTVAGDVDVDVTGTVARVDLVQQSAAGDVAIDLPGGGLVAVDGTVVDTGASQIETSVITRVDTRPGDTGFFFHLADDTASSDEASRGEPVLRIARGAVTLGANAGFATAGNLVLERDLEIDPRPAIDAGGNTVVLVADANLDGAGAIVASDVGTTDVANAGALVAFAGSGVGSEDQPLRTSAFGASVSLAGKGGSGDFWLANTSGRIAVDAIPLTVANAGVTESVSFRGLYAGGDVVLDNGGREIELRAVQEVTGESLLRPSNAPSVGLTGTEVGTDLRYGFGELRIPLKQLTAADPVVAAPSVQSGGSQRFVGSVILAADAELVAGGDVTFEGDIDSLASGAARSLDVNAGGTTTFTGDVGASAPLDALVVTDARFTDGVHTVTVASGDFRAIDGPGSLVLRGIGPGSRIEFRDDVGAAQPLASFDADADLLVFGSRSEGGQQVSSADRIAADSVQLNNDPATADNVSVVATIADTSGGLSIESAGDVAIGAGEKLSVSGPLAIRAAGAVRVADLAATDLRIDASQIEIRGRDPGQVELPGGALVRDYGVDWVANDIVTNVTPVWDEVGSARPTFVLGSGGVLMPGAIPYDVIRFTPDLDRISAASFAGNGRQLDLTGLGPRVVSDASQDVPRAVPPVRPFLEARATDTPPLPPPDPSAEQVLSALRCRTTAGDACAPAAIGDGVLASERTREIELAYHALVTSDAGQRGLVAAFAPLGGAGLPRNAAGSLDGRALYRSLATDPGLAAARERVDELAVILAQVSLLGLDESGTESVRRSIAADFAAATELDGLDAGAALDAVAASGVAVLP